MELKKLLELAVVPFILLVALWMFSGMLPQYYQLFGIYAWFWNGLLVLVIYLLVYVLTGYFVTKKFGRQEAFGVVLAVSLVAAVGYILASFINSLEKSYNSVSGNILETLYCTPLLIVASLIVNYPAAWIGVAFAESQKEKKNTKEEDNKMAILRAIVCLALALVSSYYMFLGYFGCHVCEPPSLLESSSLLWGLIAYLLVFFVIKPHPVVRSAIGLIAIITFLVLFSGFGMLCPACPSACMFQTAGISCVSSKIGTNNGQLWLRIGQATGHPIRINGVACTQETSADYLANANIVYSPLPMTNITMDSSETAMIADPTSSDGGVAHVKCTDANDQPLGKKGIGTSYVNGRIFVNYTEMDTNITRIATATYTARYEA